MLLLMLILSLIDPRARERSPDYVLVWDTATSYITYVCTCVWSTVRHNRGQGRRKGIQEEEVGKKEGNDGKKRDEKNTCMLKINHLRKGEVVD